MSRELAMTVLAGEQVRRKGDGSNYFAIKFPENRTPAFLLKAGAFEVAERVEKLLKH
ncbi:MAG TPA: hypothetical protein VI728_11485 [Syntrophales bacterium]|nr:hypothetical protein [Syntrophales bacterium]